MSRPSTGRTLVNVNTQRKRARQAFQTAARAHAAAVDALEATPDNPTLAHLEAEAAAYLRDCMAAYLESNRSLYPQ